MTTIGDMQGEFFLEVTDGGNTILTCTHGGFTDPAPKFVSEDGGTTWRELVVDPPTGVSGDCWVDVGDDGTWYFIDSQAGGNTVSSTRDGGRTWTVNRAATVPVGGTADRPYMVPLGGSRMALTYVQSYLVPGFVAFTRTTDNGQTWEAPRRISQIDDTRTNVMHGPMLVADEGRTIRVPLFQFQAQDYPSMGPAQGTLGFMKSTDGGDSFRYEPVLPSVEALFVPPAVAAVGSNLYWAYQVGNGSGQDIMLLTSVDDGATWRPPVRIAGGIPCVGYMWIDGAPDGSAVLSLDAEASLVTNEKQGEHLILIRLDATSDGIVDWTLAPAVADNAEFSTVAHDDAGRVYASYRHRGTWLLLRERT